MEYKQFSQKILASADTAFEGTVSLPRLVTFHPSHTPRYHESISSNGSAPGRIGLLPLPKMSENMERPRRIMYKLGGVNVKVHRT